MAKKRAPRTKNPSGNLLKPVCIAGAVLALILSAAMLLFISVRGRNSPSGEKVTVTGFDRELRDYDLFDAPKRVLAGEAPDTVEKRLSRLQKQARGVEELLSVIKRRRALAILDRRYTGSYAKAAREAADTYVNSAPLAALAADAAVLADSGAEDAPLSSDTRALLEHYVQPISQNRFGNLELAVRILAGEFDDSYQAAKVPGLLNLISLDLSGFGADTRLDLLTDEFLLRAVRGDIPGASGTLNTLLSGYGADTGLQRMAAEFFYDHRNPLKAAELFSRLGGQVSGAPGSPAAFEQRFPSAEGDLSRAADALVLAGELPGARNIWLALSSQPAGKVQAGNQVPAGNKVPAENQADSSSADELSKDIGLRSLYNLASSSGNKQEESAWLEKLFSRLNAAGKKTSADSTGIFSIIRYTRLLDTQRSIAILDEDDLRQDPLLDLELLRRRLESLPPTRAAAEVWLLLERHPDTGTLYEWAAWYFDHQKLYAETSRLLDEAGRRGLTGPWFELHRGLALVRGGKTNEGEKVLREAGVNSTDWRFSANLGSIGESRKDVSAALEYYETAASLLQDQLSSGRNYVSGNTAEKSDAALIQMRLSRCLEALGRTDESRRALEYASELDPANLNIRLELRRFGR